MKHLKSKIMWPFNRKKKSNQLEQIVGDLQSKMFPGGYDELEQQVEELKKELEYDSRVDNYYTEDIKGTLLYMTTLFNISQDKSAERIVRKGALNRPHNKFCEYDAMIIYKYVIKQHLIKTHGQHNDAIFDYFYNYYLSICSLMFQIFFVCIFQYLLCLLHYGLGCYYFS